MTYFHHIGLIPDDFPNRTELRAPRQLVLDALADFGDDNPEAAMPSGALVDVLGDLGVGSAASRAALSRLSRRGLLLSVKSGRTTSYRLPAGVRDGIKLMDEQVWQFGEHDREWDDAWTVVIFTLNEDMKSRSHQVRNQLRWLGFGPIRDGVWISPHAEIDLTAETMSDLLGEQALMLRGTRTIGTVDLRRAWPIDEIENEYSTFIDRCRDTNYRLRAGHLSDVEALCERADLLHLWRRFPIIDPDLPMILLPGAWPRRRAREMFVTLMDALEPLAKRRIQKRLEPFGSAA